MREWFYVEGSAQVGPVAEAEVLRLIEAGTIRRWTMVWSDGMPDWVCAGDVPALFPEPSRRPAAEEIGAAGTGRIESHLAKAILSTILCCLPFGIVAIVYAARVPGEVAAGDYPGARESSRLANLWGNVAVITGIVSGVVFGAMNIVFD